MTTYKEKLSGYFHCDMEVRKDQGLTDISKLIFGDIAYFYFLGEGLCHANNGFFAKKYGKSKGTISKAVSKLESSGYIKCYYDEYRKRSVYVNRTAFSKDCNHLSSEEQNLPNSKLDITNDSPENTSALENTTNKKGYDYNKYKRVSKFFNDEESN